MPFKQGHKKIGGRKKGTPNKLSQSFRTKIKMLLEDQWDQLITDLDKLSARDRVDAIIKLIEYAVPKLTRAEVEDVTFDIDAFLQMSREERLYKIKELEKSQITKLKKSHGS